ncbi:MAG: DUF882 domain-containing protein, partial [Pseudomonadota bacterium]
MLVAPTDAANERAISFYNIHTRENLTIVYKRNGKYIKSALEKLNWFLRDWRANVPTKMDPKLFDLLADIHRELGSERPIHVISGFRSPKTNAMLRRTRGGQARRSFHMLGKAIDVHFPDVPVRQLRYSALVRQVGGVGYYPTSSIPFVHVDTGRVRHWPRMRRTELALLFPRGRTRHVPSDRRPITRRDFSAAKKARPGLARQVAAFHDIRRNGRASWQTQTQIASATPTPRIKSPRPRVAAAVTLPPIPKAEPAPRLVASPRLVAADPAQKLRDQLAAARADEAATRSRDRRRLASLVAGLPPSKPRVGPPTPTTASGPRQQQVRLPVADSEPSWVPAPEFDDDHSEELFYAPFPVSPYLTETPSIDDDALVVMRHPDASKTLAMLAESGGQPMVKWVRG